MHQPILQGKFNKPPGAYSSLYSISSPEIIPHATSLNHGKVSRPYCWGLHSHEIVRPRRTSAPTSPAKSRAYCCCLQFWLPIACVVLGYCLCDQHMHYGHVMSACSSTLPDKSRVYCCCLQFWLPIACVVLDYCPCDQHMHYGALDLLKNL